MILLAFFQGFGKFHFTISSLKLIKKRPSLNFIVYSFFQLRNDYTVLGRGPHFKNQPFRFSKTSGRWPVQNFISLNILGLLINLIEKLKHRNRLVAIKTHYTA